jgi:hypothetical protein
MFSGDAHVPKDSWGLSVDPSEQGSLEPLLEQVMTLV